MDDFLIIGGGIAGVSAGARLAGLGSVTLLEAEPALGYHASGRSAALYEPRYGSPSTVALSLASGDFYLDTACEMLTPRGLMMVANADEQATFEADCDGMEMTRISPEEACAIMPILNPEMVAHAAKHDEAWDIDTDRLIQHFARELRRNGRIVTGAQAVAIRRLPNGWEVDTGGETYSARNIVNAAGAWVDEIAAMAGVAPIGITPLRRSMARIEVPGGHDASAWPMCFGPGESWYAKPDAGALIVSPADQDPVAPQDAWADDMVLAEGIFRFSEYIIEEVTRMIANWAGLRSFAPDHNLVIGPASDDPTFLWFAGQGGYGFQTAPAASALLADIVAGRPGVIDAESRAMLDPARFN